jgi:CelD/BcsL family acetyltransferase involved in cellulose biosynthesis
MMQAHDVSVQTLSTLEEFLTVRKEWNLFVEQSTANTLFFRHEWFEYSWRRVLPDARPLALIARQRGEIKAIAPLMIHRRSLHGLPVTTLAFLSHPDTPISDVILGLKAQEGLGAILDTLLLASVPWDLIQLDKMPGESQTGFLLRQLAEQRGLLFASHSGGKRMVLQNAGNWQTYLAGRSPRFRKTLRNIVNRIDKLERVTVEHHQQPEDLQEVLEQICSVSQRSWKVGIGMAITSEEKVRRFFAELSLWACQDRRLDVWLLKVDGIPVAMEYDLIDHDKVWAIRSDFDEAAKSLSPGTYLNYAIAKHFMTTGLKEYDMGPGANEYKLRWTDQYHSVVACTVSNRTFYARALFWLEHRMTPILRAMKERFGGARERGGESNAGEQ